GRAGDESFVTHPSSRAGRSAAPAAPSMQWPTIAPHAALLIDFDNVTLGIRSDLTKELRTLMSSDIIKGKVAVQRAYADWRRYPQYIVPLSESSIDLIFAPAFGTNKKNATDIRLAVDAIELVFTRPEIGTFILLSGDSDFSTLVIKLKEYGKYVVGVGIRESASDILIQNCDEYYSYSDLAGLTKESDLPSVQRDPWELVGEAVAKMTQNDDVMRSDRLKQVMQQIDPNFDESNAGFNRFSKFVTEAGTRGLIKVTKLENGQYEVAAIQGKAAAAPSRKGAAAPAEKPAAEGGRAKGRERDRGRGRGRGRGRAEEAVAEQPAPSIAAAASAPASSGQLTLAEAFSLLGRAILELPAPAPHEALRARMSALHGREDPLLDTGRFFKLLRQANDAEVADVKKLGEDNYEISPNPVQLKRIKAQAREAAAAAPAATQAPRAPEAKVDAEAPAATAAATNPAALRFRRGSRSPTRSSELSLVGVVKIDDEPAAAKTEAPAAKAPKATKARKTARKSTKKAKAADAGDTAAAPAAKATKSAAKSAPRRARAKK
ncbi:MAG: NYN domain-containing protein, partial [Gemmatimonadales bacterium]|nr:NYN domain-containing protein [Gemmatimonadales bacterium]